MLRGGRGPLCYMLPKKRGAGEAELGKLQKKAKPEEEASLVVGKQHSSVMASDGSASEMEIDEDLHSRQLAVYGRETMRRLFGARVLICGLQGLGAEIGTFRDCLLLNFCCFRFTRSRRKSGLLIASFSGQRLVQGRVSVSDLCLCPRTGIPANLLS